MTTCWRFQAVNNGDYDKNKDAVVVLENDLDLTGVVWTPIGNVFDENGYIEHCFSGKFYGNGHTISNIDFTSIYGKDLLVGFFGDIEEAEVSGLTIEGNLDVTNTDNEYTVYALLQDLQVIVLFLIVCQTYRSTITANMFMAS